ncbi:MAG: PQQ-binding-like beta-propeller repeat protein [Planctomycetota bacterium]
MRLGFTPLIGMAVWCCSGCATTDYDWPQFRGPDGQGHSRAIGVPLRWSETENVVWKTPIPGSGWSSPVVSGEQVWMTSASDDGLSLRAVCVDRESGKVVHDVEVFERSDGGRKHSQNTHASPTPVLDREHVFVHFGAEGTACLDRDGNVIWRKTEFSYVTPHGGGASPILHGRLLILCCDGSDKQFVVALDKTSGDVVWKKDRLHLEDARRKDALEKPNRRGLAFIGFATPLVVQAAGREQLVSVGADHMASYDVNTGDEIWWMPFNGFSLVARPSLGNGLVYASGALRDGHFVLYAIPADSTGKVEETDVVWQSSVGIPHVPCPLLVGTEIYGVHDGGITTCFDALNGETIWKERLPGNYRASPVQVGDRVYCLNRKGEMTILSTGQKFEILASNQLEGNFFASPAVAGRSLFLRSATHLYRIENSGNES